MYPESMNGFMDQVKDFLAQRFYELLGLGIIILSLCTLVALISHSPWDPSTNTATSLPISNWLGVWGANTSRFYTELFGHSSYLLMVFAIAVGYRWMMYQTANLSWRGPLFLLGWISSLALTNESFSGAFGYLITRGVYNNLSPLITSTGLTVLLCIISLSALFISLGMKIEYVRAIMTFLSRIGSTLLDTLWWIKSLLAPNKTLDEEGVAIPDDLYEPIKAYDKATRKRRKPTEAPSKPLPVHPTSVDYSLPSLELLTMPKTAGRGPVIDDATLQAHAEQLEEVLQDFGIRGEIVKVRPGPVVTLYELEPAPGVKSSRIIGLADDIARSMSAISARVAVVPGKNVIGIELPNPRREMVHLRELIESSAFKQTEHNLAMILGKDIGGEPVITDLTKMPHLLVAGTTGSGKSVGVNSMIVSLLYRMPPDRCKFIMIDPKMLELSIYDGIPHLLAPVVTDPRKAVVALKWVVREMESRYQAMSKVAVRNIEGYNQRILDAKSNGEVLTRKVQTGFDPESGSPIFEEQELDMNPLPFIVVVVDEMADLMLVAGKDIEAAVQRLAQMARAAGIHLIMATQRPSVDVITGTIKANFPTRISFQVTSKIDSRTILSEPGGEQLLGQGDMLYMASGGRITRVHGPSVGDKDVEKVVQYLKSQQVPDYVESITKEDEEFSFPGLDSGNDNSGDELYDKALAIVYSEGKASTSFIQRQLKIGYNKAADLIDRMEKDGIVSAANHVGKREVLARADHAESA